MSKTAIVTGSSRGIGRAIALRLARQGYSVVVNYAGNKTEADKVVAEIESTGGTAIAVQADVANSADVTRLFDQAEEAFGGINILINNAGIMTLSPLAQANDDAFDRLFSVNVRGTFNTLRLAAARLRSGGRILNFSSTALALALPTYSLYNATKAAVEQFTLVLAKELRGRSITVNTVAPGPTATDLFLNDKTPEMIDRFSKMSPLERLGTAEDIAGVVAFLVGPDAGWINGQTIRVNGGIA